MSPFIKDPKTGEKSATLTILIVGFAVSVVKLFLAGNIFGGVTFGQFSGTDFAAVMAALGSIYSFRKFTDKDSKSE